MLAVSLASVAAPMAHSTGLVVDTITASIAATGTFNLKDNAVIVRTTPYATIQAYVKTGFNGAGWDGFGIDSSTAAANNISAGKNLYAVGILDNSVGGGVYDSFFGHNTTSHDQTLARYTYYADSDLNGFVNTDDLNLWIDNQNTVNSNWVFGDWDFSGFVDADDLNLYLDTAGLPPILPSPPAPPSPDLGSGVGVVPEPGAFAMMAVGILGLLSRRNRK